MKELNHKELSTALEKIGADKQIFSAVIKVENGDASQSWIGSIGSMKPTDQYFVASVTKLYVSAIIIQLIEEGRLKLEDKLSKYLSDSILDGLHIYKGVDYSRELDVRHLISNTSGIPDYFFHKDQSGKTAADDLLLGNDQAWPLEKSIGLVKQLKPNFKPGVKAAYSDSNYQLLGKIIEVVTKLSFSEALDKYVVSKLGLQNTYLYRNASDLAPVPFYYDEKKLWLPAYMASIGPEGGVVSTASDQNFFLKAFFSGVLFPKERIEELKQWRMIFPPPGLFYFGIGLEKLFIPWIFSPFKYPGEILGFWGQTGSFSFYSPKSDLFFSGTTNQINGRGHRKAASFIINTVKAVL